MDMTHTYWEENSNIQRVKYESCNSNDEVNRLKDGLYPCCDTNLNFSTATCSEDDCDYGPYKKNKVTRQDPMSHRIIEKRRRDRMNNCLADLSRLIPTEYLKKGRGRIEKTEIIEMAIKHMKYLQQEHGSPTEHYRLGYQECMSEAMRFMVEVEGHFPREAICVRLLNHLQKHCEAIARAPNVPPCAADTAPMEHLNVNLPHSHDRTKNNSQANDSHRHQFQVAKSEPEPNNNNDGLFAMRPQNAADSDYEKQSYKYKTNIKIRFNQDVNASQDGMVKRQKTENGRRNSVTSIENQSSSHSSPPSSELCTRISDSENTNRRSPSDSTLSLNNNLLKSEHRSSDVIQNRFSPISKSAAQSRNFNIPIFMLHAKGSYYIPLTIDYKTVLPFLQNYDLLEVLPSMHSVVLHPVTINVNFQPTSTSYANDANPISNNKYKSEFAQNWQ